MIGQLSILLVTLGALSHASASGDVCSWRSDDGFSLATRGYEWGGGSFSTVEECGIALRATLLFVDLGVEDRTGLVTFVNREGKLTKCIMKQLLSPISKPPREFSEEMGKAYRGESSVAKISAYKSYLDENISFECK